MADWARSNGEAPPLQTAPEFVYGQVHVCQYVPQGGAAAVRVAHHVMTSGHSGDLEVGSLKRPDDAVTRTGGTGGIRPRRRMSAAAGTAMLGAC
jgi:hypothetical protein